MNTWDFRAIAEEYAAQLNSATPDCTAEKREAADVERQIANGVKAVLSGLSVPELSAEIDRLRQRKLDLESVIAAKQQNSSHIYTPEEIHGALLCLLNQFEPRNAVRALVQKIYANTDGSCTVHIGVHIPGAGGPAPPKSACPPALSPGEILREPGAKRLPSHSHMLRPPPE